LLDSIAHDLTAPISSVASALTTLNNDYPRLEDATRRELIGEAEREAQRLHRFSSNLVNLSRLEAGTIRLQRELVDIGDLVGSALARARNPLGARRVAINLPPDLPPLKIDFVLMEQVVFNLLENATKYSPIDAAIEITAQRVEAGIALLIADNGPGFLAEERASEFLRNSTAHHRCLPGDTERVLASRYAVGSSRRMAARSLPRIGPGAARSSRSSSRPMLGRTDGASP
jgi:two-component system sensor histidine kinase KdpD